MPEKTIRIPFTEAVVKAIPAPKKGRWHHDSKTPGLALQTTATGSKSFYFYKWHDGKPLRVLLGKHPQLTVKNAQDAAKEHDRHAYCQGGDPQGDRR